MKKGWLHKAAYVVMIAGIVNFLLGDFLDYNPVDETFGRDSSLTLAIYLIIGVALVYVAYDLITDLVRQKK